MQQDYDFNTVTRANPRHGETVLAVNSVIKNTYILLSMTLLFSAFTAGVSMAINFPPMNPLVYLVVVMGLFYLVNGTKDSGLGIISVFALTGFMGLTLGPMLNAVIYGFSNGAQLVATSLGLTGVIFFALSGYALTTRKDFSYMTGFLLAGFSVAMLASIAGIFFRVPAFHLAISCGFVLLSAGSILFETSRIIHGGERNYIMATVSIYISLFNLFVSLLQILAALAGRRD